MNIKIEELRKRDYGKAIQFAITGMHFNWFLKQGFALDLYGKYFLYEELNRATQALGAYVDGNFAGVLLADIDGEVKKWRSLWKSIFVKAVDFVEHHLIRGVDFYYEANCKMFADYRKTHAPDGEIVFLAADPVAKIKGVGSALLAELERREPGKLIYLYTDSGCTWQFYKRRGFTRVGEKTITLDVCGRRVPLECYLYSKRFPTSDKEKRAG